MFNENDIVQLLFSYYSVINSQWKVYSVVRVSSLKDINSQASLVLILDYPEKLIQAGNQKKDVLVLLVHCKDWRVR